MPMAVPDPRNPVFRMLRQDRRRRVRRPPTLTLFGVAFLFMPLINYVAIAMRTGTAIMDVAAVFDRLNTFEIALLFGSIPVAIGLLLVKKWGWWTFLAYAVALIAYNATVFALQPFAGNLGALLPGALRDAGHRLYHAQRHQRAVYQNVSARLAIAEA